MTLEDNTKPRTAEPEKPSKTKTSTVVSQKQQNLTFLLVHLTLNSKLRLQSSGAIATHKRAQKEAPL